MTAVARRDERVGIAAGVTAGFGIAALLARDVGGLHVACPLRTLTDVPCPGCGMTSVASSLAHGDLVGAVTASPAGVALVLALATVAVAHVLVRVHPGRDRLLPDDRVLAAVAAVALIAHWATMLLAA